MSQHKSCSKEKQRLEAFQRMMKATVRYSHNLTYVCKSFLLHVLAVRQWVSVTDCLLNIAHNRGRTFSVNLKLHSQTEFASDFFIKGVKRAQTQYNRPHWCSTYFSKPVYYWFVQVEAKAVARYRFSSKNAKNVVSLTWMQLPGPHW